MKNKMANTMRGLSLVQLKYLEIFPGIKRDPLYKISKKKHQNIYFLEAVLQNLIENNLK
jgi:hypothetical protein